MFFFNFAFLFLTLESFSGSRSPSPAPSSGLESSSIKDSPLQIDLASDGGNVGKCIFQFILSSLVQMKLNVNNITKY